MPRKPTVEMLGGIAPRQRIWDAIRACDRGATWAIDEVVAATRSAQALDGTVDPETARTYVAALQRAEIVELAKVEPGRYGRKRYRLLRDEGADAPRLRRDGSRVTQGLAQEQMWRTLRMVRGDTNARELAAHASTPDVPVAEDAAHDYLMRLHIAGYLDRTAEGKGIGRGWGKGGTGRQARYRLRADRNTGPKPPMVCRTKVVFDPNLQAVVWAPVVTEEDADHGQ